MEESQLLRGILEGCVLAVIAEGETYGYEMIAKLESSGFEALLEGTLYPILTRLEKKGMISCRKEKSPYGPMRKYYSITESGKETLMDFRVNYAKVTAAADRVLEMPKGVCEKEGLRDQGTDLVEGEDMDEGQLCFL